MGGERRSAIMSNSFHVECILKRLPQIAQWIEVFDDESKFTSKSFGISYDKIGNDDFDDESLRLEQYLVERIEEIRILNQMMHSSVAISCIFNFLYLIAQLMRDDKSKNVVANLCRFFNKYVSKIRCKRVNDNGLEHDRVGGEKTGYDQVNTFVAALLKMSLGSEIPREVITVPAGEKVSSRDENCPQITLAYGKLEGCTSMNLLEGEEGDAHPVDLSGVSLEVNIYDLCDAIKRGLKAMFCDRTMVKTLLLQMENYSVLQKEEV